MIAKAPSSVQLSHAALALAACTILAGCGGNDSSSPSPIVVGLRFQPPADFLFVGATERFVAEAVLSGGGTQVVSPSWSSSDPIVVTVDANGLARALTNGMATVTATHSGFTATRIVRVAPDFRGDWTGTLTVTTCGRDAGFPVVTFCSALAADPGRPLRLTLTQDRVQVTGTLRIFDGEGPATGVVDQVGALDLAADVAVTTSGMVFTVAVGDWHPEIQDAGGVTPRVLSGQLSMVWSVQGSGSKAYVGAVMSAAPAIPPTASARPNRFPTPPS